MVLFVFLCGMAAGAFLHYAYVNQEEIKITFKVERKK